MIKDSLFDLRLGGSGLQLARNPVGRLRARPAQAPGRAAARHWPLCNGEVVPREPQIETMVEFAHRLSSGLAFILVLILLVWAFRGYPKGHPVRLGAVLSMIFIITEALVGAGLVLFGWVATNESIGRVISRSQVHLVNTFLLVAAAGLDRLVGFPAVSASFLAAQGIAVWLFALGFLSVLVLGVSGAITALGDTLFPAGSLREGIAQDLPPRRTSWFACAFGTR